MNLTYEFILLYSMRTFVFKVIKMAGKKFIQYVTRCRRVYGDDGHVVYDPEAPHPGWDAYETEYDENGKYIPGSYKRVPEKDKEPNKKGFS